MPEYKRTGILVLLYDETRLMKLVDQLNYYIKYDQMTNVYNRNFFEKNRDNLTKDYPNFGLVATDINGLKLFNDYLGHEAGDGLIIRFSKKLKTLESDNLSIFRMGGDEFLLFVKDIEKDSLKNIKSKIKSLTQHKDIEKHISVAIGVAEHTNNESIEKTMKRADNLLYEDKKTTSTPYKEKFINYYKKTH